MENLKYDKIYKYPFIYSILAILIYNGFITAFGLIISILIPLINYISHTNYDYLESIFKITSPFSIIVSIISTLLLNLIFKNLKIYTKGNFFKTLKVFSVYLIFTISLLICVIYKNINHQFKPFNKIILGVLTLVFVIGFVEESLFRGLILNIFAKKYIDKPCGILKILIFPALIFGGLHIFNIFNKVSLEKAILQTVLAFFWEYF